MEAEVGDELVVESTDPVCARRVGTIVGLKTADGSPTVPSTVGGDGAAMSALAAVPVAAPRSTGRRAELTGALGTPNAVVLVEGRARGISQQSAPTGRHFKRLLRPGTVRAAQPLLVAPLLASLEPSPHGPPGRGHRRAWRAEWLRLSTGRARQE
jgi:Domain of unknown function (DUF1918)